MEERVTSGNIVRFVSSSLTLISFISDVLSLMQPAQIAVCRLMNVSLMQQLSPTRLMRPFVQQSSIETEQLDTTRLIVNSNFLLTLTLRQSWKYFPVICAGWTEFVTHSLFMWRCCEFDKMSETLISVLINLRYVEEAQGRGGGIRGRVLCLKNCEKQENVL